METKKVTFADRLSAFWDLVKDLGISIKDECAAFFSKQNLQQMKDECVLSFKNAFNKKFFKTCLRLFLIALLVVGVWISFAHSPRLGWWVLSLIIVGLIGYGYASFGIFDYPLFSALMFEIAALAIFCICYFVGSWTTKLFSVDLTGELPEVAAAYGFLCIMLLALGFAFLFAFYATSRQKGENKSGSSFILWLFKWFFVIALIAGLCYLILKTVLPLV